MNCDYKILIRTIDEAIVEIGVFRTIVEAWKVRDQLLDLRTMCMNMEAENPDVPVPQ